MPSSDPPKSSDLHPKSFEDSVEAIESIVSRIESGELGLEESLAAYERAAALLKTCRVELSKAEQRIVELSKAIADAGKSTA